jgi:hypothetical protein
MGGSEHFEEMKKIIENAIAKGNESFSEFLMR